MRLFLFSFLFLVTFTASANFTGSWTGVGKLTHSTGKVEECTLKIVIEQTSEIFWVHESLFDCETMKIRGNGNQPLKIIQGQLWLNDKFLGSVDETSLHTQFQAPDGRSQEYVMQIGTDADSTAVLKYFDHFEWVRGYTTSVTGHLSQAP